MWADIFYSLSAQDKLKKGQSLNDNETFWLNEYYNNNPDQRPFWDSLGWGRQQRTSAPDPGPPPYEVVSPVNNPPGPYEVPTIEPPAPSINPSGNYGSGDGSDPFAPGPDIAGHTGGPGDINLPGPTTPSGGNPITPGQGIKDYDFWNNTGNYDPNDQLTQQFLNQNPGSAYDLWLARKYGGKKNIGDAMRSFVDQQRGRFIANMGIRRNLGSDASYQGVNGQTAALGANRNLTEFVDGNEFAQMISPQYSANLLNEIKNGRYADGTAAYDASRGIGKYFADPQNWDDLIQLAAAAQPFGGDMGRYISQNSGRFRADAGGNPGSFAQWLFSQFGIR